MVNERSNLTELPHGRDPQHKNLNQREYVGRQPIAEHRLQTHDQSASAATCQQSQCMQITDNYFFKEAHRLRGSNGSKMPNHAHLLGGGAGGLTSKVGQGDLVFGL